MHALVTSAAVRLRAAGITAEEADLDAQLLAAQALGWDRTRLITSWRDSAPAHFPDTFEQLVARRERREPISQILGVREFWGLEFEVTRDVLTPRPETEGIIEAVKELCTTALQSAADVGTGTGCLAVAVAKEFPAARVVAIDISPAALAVAARNAARHGVDGRIVLRQGAVSSSLPTGLGLIVSNPPYIPDGERPALPIEVRDYEPGVALFAGPDGLDVIRDLVWQAPLHLSDGGLLVFECGAGQDAAIREMIAGTPDLELMSVRPDLAGIPRIVVARRTFLYE
jgi:release factor glutamine methyltransferase